MEAQTVEEKSLATAQKVKDEMDAFLNWGHINFESANGVIQSNCKALEFQSADEMNTYFETHKGTFAAQIFTLKDKLIMVANRTMDEEHQMILADYANELNKKVVELKAARDAAKLEEEEELKKRVADLERLQELGKKCEHNHGAVIEENQKLKKEVKALRKGK